MQQQGRWRDLPREGRTVITLVLNLAVGLHAMDVFVIAAVMPTVVREIGGAAYYTWSTMLYMVASIIGAASAAPLKAGFGTRKAFSAAGLLFALGTAGCGSAPGMAALLLARTVQGFGG